MAKRKWLYIALATILIFVGIRIYTAPYMQLVHSRHEAFDVTFSQYSQAVLARDYTTAYSFGGREFRNALSEADFAAEQQSLETRLGMLESSSTERLNIDGKSDPGTWRANVLQVRHYKNGDVRLLYEFRLEDGQWKLFGYQEPK